MTDIEINKALALAIGWTEDRRDENGCLDPDVIIEGALFGVKECVFVWVNGNQWQAFDYRDPTVIWPIAERYNAFPRRMYLTWCALHRKLSPGLSCPYYADTAAKAVALAVIGAAS